MSVEMRAIILRSQAACLGAVTGGAGEASATTSVYPWARWLVNSSPGASADCTHLLMSAFSRSFLVL